MSRFLLAAAAAFALTFAAPSQACPDCKDCPHAKVAAGEKAPAPEKKEVAKGCPCGEGKACKCGAKCDCPHCQGAKPAPKTEQKKT